MNVISTIISENVLGFAKLGAESKVELEQATLLFLFRGLYLRDLKLRFAEYGLTFGPKTHTKLWGSGYVMMNVKLWLYRCAKLGIKHALECAKDFDIQPDDLELASAIKGTELAALFADYINTGYPSFSLSRWQTITTKLMLTQNSFVAKHAYFKGRFLQSWSIPKQDLIDEMNEWALTMTYCEYPRFETPLHLHNKYRQFCRQRLLKIISKNTTQARQRMTSTFDMLVLDIDNIPAGWANSDALRVGMAGDQKDVDLTISLRQVMRKAKPKQVRFLKLMMGITTPDFETFLSDNRYARNSESLADKDMPRYIDACCSYIGVSVQAGQKYLSRIGQVLDPNRG